MVITSLSTNLKINSFYVSLVFSPLVLNSKEILESIPTAKKKTSNSISMILYAINGTVTVNNSLDLGIFLAVIYKNNLQYIYSAEIITLLFVIFYVGLNSLRNVIKLWQTIIILLLYPISILVIYLLKTYSKIENEEI